MSVEDRGTASKPDEIPFTGVRLRSESAKSFGSLVDALLADVGERPLDLGPIVAEFDDWASFEAEVQRHVGPSGFVQFTSWDHGAWIAKAGIDRRVLRVVIGNPLIAITMLRHDVTAGLFAPVELLLTQEDHDRSAVTYVRPSSMMVVEPNPPLLSAALALDEKLARLVSAITTADGSRPR